MHGVDIVGPALVRFVMTSLYGEALPVHSLHAGLPLGMCINKHGGRMASRCNIYSDLVISRNELEISPIHFLISLNI